MKETLIIQLGQLVHFMNHAREDLRSDELRTIQRNLSPTAGAETVAVTSFITILREGRIESIREIKARAEDMWNTRDELMDEVDLEDDLNLIKTSNFDVMDRSNGDTPMPNAPDALSDAMSESDASSKRSTKTISSNDTMDDA